MPTERDLLRKTNPPGLHETPGYHHVTIVETGRVALLAGQCPLRPDGKLVGETLLEQVDQVIANIEVALAHLGRRPGDVARTVVYVASGDRKDLAAVWEQLTASSLAGAFTSASTLLGVTSLGYAGQLVEVDVTVALSGETTTS